MTKNRFDKHFWESLYEENSTGWNIGYPSTPIKTYIDQLKNKNLKILIPGAGNAYEAEYLHNSGFTNVWLIDLAKKPLENFKKRVPDFPQTQLIQGDFFEHNSQYDIIVEQTFFCALDPILRNAYAERMSQLLKSGGKLIGLLFNFELTSEGPPFGGNEKEYQKLFSNYFKIEVLEAAYNSIKPRSGREFFIIFEKLT